MTRRKTEKEQAWTKKVEDYNESGLGISAWCKKNNEKPDNLRYWKRKLCDSKPLQTTFEELQEDLPASGVEIRYSELVFNFPNGANLATLQKCLSSIGSA